MVGLSGEDLPAQSGRCCLPFFVNIVGRLSPLLGKNRCRPPSPQAMVSLKEVGEGGAPMLPGVCHLLNGCLGETFIKAALCRTVKFHLRFFFPGKVSVYFGVLSVCIVYLTWGFSPSVRSLSVLFRQYNCRGLHCIVMSAPSWCKLGPKGYRLWSGMPATTSKPRDSSAFSGRGMTWHAVGAL